MKETEAIRAWQKNFLIENPQGFVFKLPDSTKCAMGHPTATGKKPFDLIAVDKIGFYYFEFKVSRSKNPEMALAALAPHQVESLARIGRLNPAAAAGVCVYVPPEFRGDKRRERFVYFFFGADCRSCQLKQNLRVCKICPWSKADGSPDLE